jgi:hypothetical protein
MVACIAVVALIGVGVAVISGSGANGLSPALDSVA